jgi:uncharacterized protein YceH (UPF0502 family)
MQLSPEEGRVIGSLVEKQLTTPQQYPLTLNALVLACNQSSNRDPVVSYQEGVIEAALVTLREAGLVGFMYPSHGRTVTRYRHTLGERLGLDERELALLGVLLLRGPQTAGELRARTERLARFDGIGAVDADLERLGERPEPLVVRLTRRPGQKEERWVQLLTAGPGVPTGGVAGSDQAVPTAAGLTALHGTSAVETVARACVSGAGEAGHDTGEEDWAGLLDERLTLLADEVGGLAVDLTRLRAEVAELRAALSRLNEQLGG